MAEGILAAIAAEDIPALSGQRQQRDGKTLSVLVSELLAKALAQESTGPDIAINWPTAPMGARIDIDDSDALRAVLDEH